MTQQVTQRSHLRSIGFTFSNNSIGYYHSGRFIILKRMAYDNNNDNKKIYDAHIVMNHESEAQAVARWPDGEC